MFSLYYLGKVADFIAKRIDREVERLNLDYIVISVLDCPISSLRNERHHPVEQFEEA
jgi:hypothetical protein